MLETSKIQCPYCGETIETVIDCSVSEQTYIEDCQVCCRPITLAVTVAGDAIIDLAARREDE